MKKIISILYTIWVFIVFTVFMLLLLPGMTIPFLFGHRFSFIGYYFLWLWAWIFSQLTFIRYRISGKENLLNEACIYVSNHTSFLDAPGIRLMIPTEFRPIAKRELQKIPVFGWIVQTATVAVDRNSKESKAESMRRLKFILSKKIPLLFFAEGTQNRTSELLQPFKDGAFRMALEMQTPIVPVVIYGAGALMPPGTIRLSPGNIYVHACPPIHSLATDTVPSLKQKTFDVMLKNLQELQAKYGKK